MKNNKIIILFLLLLLVISRYYLLSLHADFFDATEYLQRTSMSSFWQAISTGHPPYHPLFLAFSNILYKMLLWLNIDNAALAITSVSATFGVLTIIVFYFFSKKIFGQNMALFSSMLATIIPYLWISSITILVDPSGLFFLILALYLYWLAIESDKTNKKIVFIITSGLAYGACLLVHTSFGIWLPLFLGLLVLGRLQEKNWKKFFRNFWTSWLFFIGSALAILAYINLLIYGGFSQSKTEALRYLLIGNINDHLAFDINRWALYVSSEVTLPLTIAGFLAILIMFWKKEKTAVLFIFWLIPSFIASTYIYENLHGRALLPLSFALTILAAYFVFSFSSRHLRLLFGSILILGALAVSLPAVYHYKYHQAANEILPQFEAKLANNGLLVGTNIMRTWNNYAGLYERLGDVDVGTGTVLKDIESYRADSKPVYLSSDAIFYPYWRYDGHFFDLRTLGLPKIVNDSAAFPLAAEFFEDYNYDLELSSLNYKKYILKLDNNSNLSERLVHTLNRLPANQSLVIGQLKEPAAGGTVGRAVVKLYGRNFHLTRENILSNDLFYKLYRFAKAKNDPLIWGISDSQGLFILPTNESIDQEKLTVLTDPYNSRIKGGDYFFTSQKEQSVAPNKIKTNLNKDDLLREISGHNPQQSFYIKKDKDRTTYDLITFSSDVVRTNKIEAENLAHFTGEIINDNQASQDKAALARFSKDSGFLTAGPYLTLESGQYQLKVRVRIGQFNPDKDDFGQIEIVGRDGKVGLGEKKFNRQDLPNLSQYQTITIDFTLLEKTSGMEFRTRASANCDLYLDYFELEKLS